MTFSYLQPDDPELKGRIFNQFKGKYSSRTTDPWMKSRYTIHIGFLNWLISQRQRQRKQVSVADLKAEIRNDYIRAGDLWDEYQESLGKSANSNSSQLLKLTAETIETKEQAQKKRAETF